MPTDRPTSWTAPLRLLRRLVAVLGAALLTVTLGATAAAASIPVDPPMVRSFAPPAPVSVVAPDDPFPWRTVALATIAVLVLLLVGLAVRQVRHGLAHVDHAAGHPA